MKSTIRNCIVISLLVFQAADAQDDPPPPNIYVTSDVVDNQPTMKKMDIFDCTDRIYLVLEALNLPKEDHELSVRWFNPAGELEEKTNYSFPHQPFVRVWAWLQLSGPPGAVIGQVFDPSFGMEKFIGTWSAKVSMDNRKLKTVTFDVLC